MCCPGPVLEETQEGKKCPEVSSGSLSTLVFIPLQAAIAGHNLYLCLLPLERLIPRELLLTFVFFT